MEIGPKRAWGDEALHRLSAIAGRRAAVSGGHDRIFPGPPDRQPRRSDAAGGCDPGGPAGDDQGPGARWVAVSPVLDLHHQRPAWRPWHVDPHAPAGSRGVLRPPTEHA